MAGISGSSEYQAFGPAIDHWVVDLDYEDDGFVRGARQQGWRPG